MLFVRLALAFGLLLFATPTLAMSIAHDDDIAALNPAEPDVIRGHLSTNLRLTWFKANDPSVDRIRTNVRNGNFDDQSLGARDSLRNGAIIGAVIGAAAFGALAAALCNAYQEEGGPSCWPDTLRFAAIGGAIGAGAGLAIDAVRTQRGITVRFAVRF